jgi:hypothetical protein
LHLQGLAASALANLSSDRLGLEAFVLDQDMVLGRIFATLQAANTACAAAAASAGSGGGTEGVFLSK